MWGAHAHINSQQWNTQKEHAYNKCERRSYSCTHMLHIHVHKIYSRTSFTKSRTNIAPNTTCLSAHDLRRAISIRRACCVRHKHVHRIIACKWVPLFANVGSNYVVTILSILLIPCFSSYHSRNALVRCRALPCFSIRGYHSFARHTSLSSFAYSRLITRTRFYHLALLQPRILYACVSRFH